MPTPAQIDEQIQLERDAIAQGLKKLHKNTRDLEGKEYASASVYGAASIDTLLPLVVARIEATTSRLRKGNAGIAFREIQQYLSDVEHWLLQLSLSKLHLTRYFHTKRRAVWLQTYAIPSGLLLNKSVKCGTMRNMHPVFSKH